jgi:hypothetical protein
MCYTAGHVSSTGITEESITSGDYYLATVNITSHDHHLATVNIPTKFNKLIRRLAQTDSSSTSVYAKRINKVSTITSVQEVKHRQGDKLHANHTG